MRNKNTIAMLGAVVLAMAAVACNGPQANTNEPALSHTDEVMNWRAERLASLRGETGFLNLVGLFWLPDGTTTFGSGDDSDIVFPRSGLDRIGTFETRENGLQMTVAEGADIRIDGEPVTSVFLPDDSGEEQVTATLGSLSWTVINRDEKLAVRLRDLESPALAAFPEIPYFDIDEQWLVEGRLQLFDEPRVINVGTVIEGLGWNPTSPGVVSFEIDGTEYSLEAYESGEQFFFVFGDRTSGKETYPAGRFLYADKPLADGKVVMDFNRSYNPPCAFNDFSTCPVASPRNRLPVRIEAGEKYIPALHVAGAD